MESAGCRVPRDHAETDSVIKLKDLTLSDYESTNDDDYIPSKLSEDDLEYNSHGVGNEDDC